MRIGLFTDTYPPYINGVSTSVNMLKNSLEELGHTVYVITVNPKSVLKYEYDEKNKILKVPGIETGIYDYRLGKIYSSKVSKKIKEWKLDVIHSHSEFSMGIMARMIGRELNLPIIHTYHTLLEDYTYYVLPKMFDGVTTKLVEYLTKFYCETTAAEVIVPTEKIYELFRDKYKLSKQLNIIPTGIEVERFKKEKLDKKLLLKLRKEYNLSKKDFVIITVGRLAKEKNFELTIKAMKKIIKQAPNIKLLIVGDGPYKEELQKITKEEKLSNNVIFVGKVAWDDMPYYYGLGDIYTSASLSETQGLTVIEAMAGGLTPVCIKDQAFSSMITNTLDGYIYKNEDEYQTIVLKLSKNRKLLDITSKKGIEKADEYSANTYAKKVLKVYNKAIKEKKEDNRYGIFSKIYNKLKGDKNVSSK